MPKSFMVHCPLCGSRLMSDEINPIAGVIYQESCQHCGREFILQFAEISGQGSVGTDPGLYDGRIELLQVLQVFGETYRINRRAGR